MGIAAAVLAVIGVPCASLSPRGQVNLMTGSNSRKRDAFAKKAKRMKVNLEATEEVARAARRLLTQVVWIALILFTVAGMVFPDLHPIVARAISLLGTKVV